jgi:hypothetical protein
MDTVAVVLSASSTSCPFSFTLTVLAAFADSATVSVPVVLLPVDASLYSRLLPSVSSRLS